MTSKILAFFNQDKNYKKSYSQNGEDIIVENILSWLNVEEPVYLDIGTYHPSIINNTYKLYQAGFSGICIEPNPTLFAEIKKYRQRDICLNVGISDRMGKGAFYVMANRTLNTMLKEQALYYQNSGQSKIESEIQIDIVTFAYVIETYLPGKTPNFISLDIEGMDYLVLQSIDFHKYRPSVLCIETKDAQHKKVHEIIQFMEQRGYFVCADTFINSIFVESEAWEKRKR